MASRRRGYRSRRLQAFHDDPQLLIIGPAPPSAGLNDLKPFNLSTVLMAVHKHSYTSLNPTQQGGPRRRETMHPVIGSLLVRAVEKARKARAEIVKMLQGFGCEQVGVMDNFDDCSVLLAFTHRGRQVQLCSSARGWAA